MDKVQEFIDLRKQKEEIEEKILAYEQLILTDLSLRKDKRITIISPRKTYTITDDAYERLQSLGYETTVTEVRPKKLGEFEEEVQTVLLANDDNFILKLSKESIRIK